MTPIIDVCDSPYDTLLWRACLQAFIDDAPQYLTYFGPALARLAGVDAKRLAAVVRDDLGAAADLLAPGLAIDIDDHATALRATGVRHQVIHGGPWTLGTGTENANDRTALLAARHPGLLSAWGGIRPTDADAAITEIDRCVDELGMRGMSVSHFWSRADPVSTAAHRVYAHLEHRRIPLWIHCGLNIAADRSMRFLDANHLDHIASTHPGLVLIAGHGGWPWMLDMVAVASRHANVYIETSTHKPARMARPGSGWEPVLAHAASLLQSKLLFGTLGWVLGTASEQVGELAEGLATIDLPERTVRAWLHDNAARLLELD